MSVIDDYLAPLPEADKRALQAIRRIVLRIVPDAEETISYGLPTLKYKGKYVLYFGAFKNHLSIFPGSYIASHLKLDGFKTSKGTIQFTADHPLPESLIEQIVRDRMEAIESEV